MLIFVLAPAGAVTLRSKVQIELLEAASLAVKVTMSCPTPISMPGNGLWLRDTPLHASFASSSPVKSGSTATQVLSTVKERFVGQKEITGGVVSISVTTWLQVLVWPAGSLAAQVRVKTSPLVAVSSTTRITFIPLQPSNTAGSSKVHKLPHSTVLSGVQTIIGGNVSTT
jgi:hypothetical protein